MGPVFIAAPFCDSSWRGSWYFDRNILPVLALTTLVVGFVWICCHVISFCSNYKRLIGKGTSLFEPLCRCLADRGCSDITPVQEKGIQRDAWAVKLQNEIMDTHSQTHNNVLPLESTLVKSLTPLTLSIIWVRPCAPWCNIYVSDF